MSTSAWIRQFHRWMAVGFVAAFIFTSVVMAMKLPLPWAVYSPLPFLFVLAITGIYMFLRPYFIGRRSSQSVGATS